MGENNTLFPFLLQFGDLLLDSFNTLLEYTDNIIVYKMFYKWEYIKHFPFPSQQLNSGVL